MNDDVERSAEADPFSGAQVNLDEQLAKYRDLKEEIEALAVTVTSPDRTVTVTVGPGGAVQNVEFAPQALRLGTERLADTLLAVIRQATVEVNRELAERVQPIAPPGVDVST